MLFFASVRWAAALFAARYVGFGAAPTRHRRPPVALYDPAD